MEKKNARQQKPTSAETKRNDKDMSASAQRARVLEYLKAGPQTTYSLRARGISHPAARVRELIARGHPITNAPVTAFDSDGYEHRNVALYSLATGRTDLLDEPLADAAEASA